MANSFFDDCTDADAGTLIEMFVAYVDRNHVCREINMMELAGRTADVGRLPVGRCRWKNLGLDPTGKIAQGLKLRAEARQSFKMPCLMLQHGSHVIRFSGFSNPHRRRMIGQFSAPIGSMDGGYFITGQHVYWR